MYTIKKIRHLAKNGKNSSVVGFVKEDGSLGNIFVEGATNGLRHINQIECLKSNYQNGKTDKYIFEPLEDSILKNQLRDGVVITRDNIALYYEFMSDEDLENYTEITRGLFEDRASSLFKVFKVDKYDFLTFKENYYYIYGLLFFRVKDTLKPIEEYIEEIKGSSEYKEYLKSI